MLNIILSVFAANWDQWKDAGCFRSSSPPGGAMHHLVHQPKSKSRRRRFKMAASKASRELFTEGVRAVLQTWPVLQVSSEPGQLPGSEPGLRWRGIIRWNTWLVGWNYLANASSSCLGWFRLSPNRSNSAPLDLRWIWVSETPAQDPVLIQVLVLVLVLLSADPVGLLTISNKFGLRLDLLKNTSDSNVPDPSEPNLLPHQNQLDPSELSPRMIYFIRNIKKLIFFSSCGTVWTWSGSDPVPDVTSCPWTVPLSLRSPWTTALEASTASRKLIGWWM